MNLFWCRHLVIWGQLSKKHPWKIFLFWKRKMSGYSSIVLTVIAADFTAFSACFRCPRVELQASRVCFIDPSMCGFLTCDLQGTVTLQWMKGGCDDNMITRLETYLWNYFQASLSCLVYNCVHPDCNRVLLSSLVNSQVFFCGFFIVRRENEHWKTKKWRDTQMQVRRLDSVLFGTDY